MEYIQKFKSYLFSIKPTPSRITVKNYSLDVKHFIDWFETKYHKPFAPTEVTTGDFQLFKTEKNAQLSLRSLDRHVSSLRKFFYFLKLSGMIAASPLEKQISSAESLAKTDPYRMKEFKDFLYVYNASNLTIKNYIIDLKQFFSWLATHVAAATNATDTTASLLPYISNEVLASYRDELLDKHVYSSSSINRKLSSLRKYITWAESQNLLRNESGFAINPNEVANIPSASLAELPKTSLEQGVMSSEQKEKPTTHNPSPITGKAYSHFPPLRLAQKISKGINLAFDSVFIAPVAYLAAKTHKAAWSLSGKPLFADAKKIKDIRYKILGKKLNIFPSSNIQYRISNISKANWYQKLFHHARYTRPNWYRRYHSLAISHYFHWAILMIVMTVIGFGFYNSFVNKPQSGQHLLAAAQPNRILSFQGRLTDSSNNPITTSTYLRFGIYTDATSTGSALLWQELDNVTPDANGVFSVLLGKNSTIQQSLFANNANLYLGITVGQTAELTPRQQLATVAYATNAETLQGLPPITQSGAGTSNVVLALNSTGNLSIGAASTFQTVGGAFTLSGDSLVLNTNPGTSGNITVAPDGQGFIDLQKPLINTTQNNNISSAAGSVEVDDTFAILATNSGVPAETINQNGAGALFTASASGVSKFTIGNSGTITASNYNTAGGIFYADGTGLLFQTTAGTTGQCLTSNGGSTPTWGTCGGGAGSNFWTLNQGALYPVNTTLDVLFGGSASTSANFAFLNNTPGTGTPTASISGNLTLNSAGFIQTTNNQGLTIGGNTTGNIVLKPLNGTGGTVTLSGYATGIIHSTLGVLSSSAVNLASGDVTGVLPLANGGTGANITGDQGGLVYFNASTTLATLAHAATSGECLLSGGTGAPTWASCSTASSNWWNVNQGALYPINDTFDLLLGGSGATTSAKFAVLNLASGTPTASVSSGLNGNATYVTANGSVQTTNFQGLTLGGTTTGNITISPLSGTGFLTINGTINSSLVPTISDTYNLGSPTNEWNNLYVKNIVSTGTISGFWQRNLGVLSPTNIADDLAIGGTATSGAKFQVFGLTGNATTAGTLTFVNGGSQIQTTSNQVLTLGGNTTGGITLSPNNGTGTVTVNGSALQTTSATLNAFTSGVTNLGFGTTGGITTVNSALTVTGNITPNGQFAASLIPTTTSINLGSPSNYFGSAYVTNLFGSINSQYLGFFQRNAGVLSPTNSTDDVAVGATSTSSAKFQIFGNTGNATTSGNLTFNASGNLIQTTNNNGLTIGGNTTGNITLSPLNNTGTVTVGGLGTGVVHATSGLLSTGFVNLTSEVTGVLPIGSGGTNTNSIAANGAVAYSNGTAYAFSAVGSAGQCLVSNGSGAPLWTACSSAAGATNYWTLDNGNGVLYPINTSLDTFIGGTSTASAHFAFLNNAGGTPTASVSSGLNGNATYVTADGTLQTTNFQGLTIGGATTGNITFTPQSGNGSVTINGTSLDSQGSTFNLLNTNATMIHFGENATSISIGKSTGTTAVNNALTVTGTATLNGNVVLGSNNTKTITANGEFNSDLIPAATNTYNLGSASLEWNNLYVNNIISGGTISGFWQRNVGVLSATNIADDLAIGGTSTSSALFQVFGNTGNATTAGTLTFTNSGSQIQTTSNQPLTIGGNTTGGITLSPNNGNGSIILHGNVTQTGSNTFTTGTGLTTTGGNLTVNGTTITVGNGSASTIQTSSNANLAINTGSGVLTLNSGGSGNIDFFSTSNSFTSAGNLTLAGTITLPNSNTITGIANALQLTNGFTVNSAGSSATHTNIDTSGNILPGSDGGANLGSAALEWNNIFAKNLFLPSSGGYDGYFQLNSGILSPTNSTNDLAIGGTSTSSALFQVFGNTGNATTAGTLTFTNSGSQIQTTSNQPLTLGGDTTGNIILKPNNGSGLITVSGDFNSSLIPGTTDTYDIGTASLEWNNLYVKNIISSGTYAGFWQRNDGALSPSNITDDILAGGTATISAKFAVLNMTGSGNPTASVSSGLNGTGMYFDSTGTIQTVRNQGLTLGGATTGNITLAPLNSGTGSIINLNAKTVDDTQSTATIFGTPTNITLAGAATTLSIGAGSGTTTVNNALTVTGTLTGNGNVVLGANNSKTITANGEFNTSLLPATTTTYDLGSNSLQWRNLYATGIFLPSSGGYGGYWQLNSGALAPTNIANDLLVGATATTSAKFSVLNIANGTPVASVSSGLSGTGLFFSADGSIQTVRDATLTLGGTTTGNIAFGSTVSSNILPYTTTTYDLGSNSLQWRNLYISGNYDGFWQRFNGTVSPFNITDDILAGGTATISAKFAVLNMTGSGNPTASVSSGLNGTGMYFDSTGTIQTVRNQGLTLGGATTGNITLAPLNGVSGSSITFTGSSTFTTGTGLTTTGGNLNVNGTSVTIGNGSNATITTAGTNSSLSLLSLGTGNITIGQNAGLGNVLVQPNAGGQASLEVIKNSPTGDIFTASSAAATKFIITNGGTVGIGNAVTDNTFLANTGLEVFTDSLGNATAVIDQRNTVGDIFTASSSGISKFTVQNDGTIKSGKYTTDKGILFADSNGVFTQTAQGATHTFLRGNGSSAPTFNAIDLASADVGSSILSLANGGTGANITGDQGGIVYFDSNTTLHTLNHSSSVGQCLLSGGTGAPTWNNCGSASSNWWSMNQGTLFPINSTLDLTLGSSDGTGSTISAKFAVLNMTGSGNPTASVSSGLNGTGMYFDSTGTIQTVRNQGLTLGGATTGNITLAPLNSGTGSIINLNAKTVDDTQSTATIFGTPTNITLAGAATTLLIGNASGTTTFASHIDSNKATLTLLSTPTTINEGATGQTLNLQGNVTLGTNTSQTVTFNGLVNASVLPSSTSINLGSPSNYWGTVYAANFISPVGGGTAGFWQLTSNVLSPVNAWNDLAVGGNATGSATPFQIFATTVGIDTAGTATSSGNLVFRGQATKINLLNGSTLNIQTSVGGDTGLASQINLANNGDITFGGANITTTQTTLALFNTTATTINFGGAATTANLVTAATTLHLADAGTTTTLSIGGSAGTTTVNNALTVTGTLTGNGNVVLGANNSKTITANGEFNTSLLPATTTTYDLGSNSLQWRNLYISGNYDGFWQRFNGTVSPFNITDDILAGGTATISAKFAVLNMTGSGNPTASVSSGLNGTGMYFDSTGTIQTVRNQGLTLGGATTGNITLAPLNSGTGSIINLNAKTVDDTQSTATIFGTPTNITLAGAATTLSIGAGSGTTTVNNALTVTGTLTGNGNVVLGANNSKTVTFNALVNSNIIPSATDTYNLGSDPTAGGFEWNNLYVRQIITPSSGGIAGYWQLNSGVLSPANLTNDLAIGGVGTGSAKFQIFANTGNATTSGNLTFNTSGVIQTTNMQPLTLGSATTGPIQLSPKGTTGLYIDGLGNVGIGTTTPGSTLQVTGTTELSNGTGDNWFPYLDGNSYLSGTQVVFRSNGNTEAARIDNNQRFGIGMTSGLQNQLNIGKTGSNFTTPGIDFFATSNSSSSLFNAGRIYSVFADATGYATARLTLASPTGSNTFVDVLSVINGAVGIGTTTPVAPLEVAGSIYGSSFKDRDNPNYFIDPAASGLAAAFNGNVAIGTTSATTLLQVAGDAQVGKDNTTWGTAGSGYSYRKQIAVANNSGQALINYQVKVLVDTASLITAGKMTSSSCADLTFADSDGSTTLSFWRESGCNTNATTYWVKVPSIPGPTKTIYMYYGKSGASDGSNTNTFVRTITNVQAAYRLDEPAYNVMNDFSGNGNFATASGTTVVTGKFGNARTFNGTSDYIDAGVLTDLNFSNNMSVDLWVKPGSATQATNADIFNKADGTVADGGYALESTGTGNTYVFLWSTGSVFTCSAVGGGNGWTAGLSLTNGVWSHVTITKSGTSAIMYKDGTSVGTCTGASSTIGSSATKDLMLGRQTVVSSHFFNGTEDEVHFYNSVLSTNEITDLASNGGQQLGYVTQASPNNEYVRNYVAPEPTTTLLNEQTANQQIPNLYVDQNTGNVVLGSNSDASTSAKLTVAGDIKSGLYDPTSWIAASNGESYRMRINIDNTGSASTSANANYQVKVTVNTATPIAAGKMRSDCADVKFTDSDGQTSLSFWRENSCNNTGTIFWVKIPLLPPAQKKNIYMYYGNSSNTTDGSSSANTFVRQTASNQVKLAWRLDETSGSITDYSNSNNTGTVNGTTATGGVYNNARSFNGSSDYIEAADSSSLQQATPLSLSAWFKSTSVQANTCIVRKDTTAAGSRFIYSLLLNGTANKVSGQYYNGTDFQAVSTSTVNDGNWHFAVMTISGTTVTIYVDGQSQGTKTITGTQSAPTGVLDIGACPPFQGGGTRGTFLNGSIDEVRLYSKALSAAEVYDLYDAGNPGGYYGYVTTNSSGNEYVRAFENPEPVTTVDTEQDPSQIDPVFYANNEFGRVGINTANPTAILDIAGTPASANTALSVSGLNLSLNTTATAAVINQTGTGKLLDIQSNGTSKLTVGSSGYVGIGLDPDNPPTATQKYSLQIKDNGTGSIYLQGADPTIAFYDTTHVMYNMNYNGANGKLYFHDTNNNADRFSFSSGAGNAIAQTGGGWTTGTPDIAENVHNTDGASAGDILVANPTASQSAIKANRPYDPTIIGAVSTHPGFLMTGDIGTEDIINAPSLTPQGFVTLALAGRVPTKVSTKNGAIKIGDKITSSTIPGVGMKATQAGAIAVEALGDFDPSTMQCVQVASLDAIVWPNDPLGFNNIPTCYQLPDGTYVGKIMALVKVSWYDPDVYLTSTGDFNITPSLAGTPYALSDATGNPITRMGAFLSLAVANIRAGFISAQSIAVAGPVNAQQVLTNSLAIATDNVSIAGQSLHDYVAGIVTEVLNNSSFIVHSSQLVSPLAEIDTIHTNIISPLASDSSISIGLNASRFTLYAGQGASGSAVASFDNQGNATFSGTLNSQNLAVNSDATISGTLHAGKIVASEIDGLQAAVGTLSAQNITNVTNIYFATPSGTPNGENSTIGSNTFSNGNNQLLNGGNDYMASGSGQPSNYFAMQPYASVASYSAFLAYVPNLNSDTAMFNQGLVSLGSTSLADTTITGQLSIDSQLILADNSINVLGDTFQIQPLRQGGVSFEGGLLAIDTDGNLTVNGNAVFSKTLAANIISPLSNDRNLNFQLGQNSSATGSALATSTFAVQNASGSGVFSIDQLGNLIASGAATIGKLNLGVQPALAVSNTEVIATGSAGTTFVKAHQTEITIDNKLVTNNSLIYITPVGGGSVTPYLLRQVGNTSFTVGIPTPQYTDSAFNWLIVN